MLYVGSGRSSTGVVIFAVILQAHRPLQSSSDLPVDNGWIYIVIVVSELTMAVT
jgi:hypothetical protein